MNAYQKVFQTTAGEQVLADLERIVNMTKIDANDPSANSAIYKCAQLALLQRIRKQIEEVSA